MKYKPKHLPEIEKLYKTSYYSDLSDEDRVKCLIRDLLIAQKIHDETTKDIGKLHDIFQKNSYPGMVGKSVITESAKILEQVFKIIPPYGDDFPYQCKCPKCDNRFFLPNYKLAK